NWARIAPPIAASVAVILVAPQVVTWTLLATIGVALTLVVRSRNEAVRATNRALATAEKEKAAREELQAILEELKKAREAGMEVSRTKSSFLVQMSHELRTPLNLILNFAEMLTEEADDGGYAAIVPDLQKIHQSAKHLLDLINDLFDISKIEAGRIDLCPMTFDVAAMIAGVASSIRPVVEKNGNVLVVECPQDLGQMFNDLTR